MLQAFSTVSATAGEPPPAVNFNGTWVNELGSRMRLAVTPDGTITGTYRTAVGAPGAMEDFQLVGFASGDLIAFTVNFGRYGSLTAWVGQHTEEAGGASIRTMWHLAQNVPDPQEPAKLWGAVLTGSNNFTR